MLFSDLEQLLSEALPMRSFDLSYNYGLLIFCKHSSEFGPSWQNNLISKLSEKNLPLFPLTKMPIGRTTIIVNCQHLIEKSLVRKTRVLDFHRGKLATRISEILLYSHIFS